MLLEFHFIFHKIHKEFRYKGNNNERNIEYKYLKFLEHNKTSKLTEKNYQ